MTPAKAAALEQPPPAAKAAAPEQPPPAAMAPAPEQSPPDPDVDGSAEHSSGNDAISIETFYVLERIHARVGIL